MVLAKQALVYVESLYRSSFRSARRQSLLARSSRSFVVTYCRSCVCTALEQSVSFPLLRAALWKASPFIFLESDEPSMARIFALVQKAVLVVSITPIQMARMLSTSAVDSYTGM